MLDAASLSLGLGEFGSFVYAGGASSGVSAGVFCVFQSSICSNDATGLCRVVWAMVWNLLQVPADKIDRVMIETVGK